ncbi:heat shock cognate 70 kDa protein 2 [Tanacetum coccineum]
MLLIARHLKARNDHTKLDITHLFQLAEIYCSKLALIRTYAQIPQDKSDKYNLTHKVDKSEIIRKALANALSIAPSMWILRNAGMGALQVAFTGSERLIGDVAKNQVSMNPTNTVYDSTRLIAEKPMIAVNYKGEEKTFTAEEVSSMIAVN